MRAELKRLQKELGISFVHVTHSQEEAMALADVVVIMHDLSAKSGVVITADDIDRDIFFFLADFMGSFARSVILAIVGWIENSLVTVQRSQHEQLAEANLKLQKYALTSEKLAQTQERNRLARELHDTLAHTLSSTSVQLEAIKALFDRNPEQAKAMLAQSGMVSAGEQDAVARVLSAAALTYVASLVQIVMQLLYFIMLVSGARRRD
jgi:signal transduction histidine kinase